MDFTSQEDLQAKIKEINGDVEMLKKVEKERALDASGNAADVK